MLFVGAVTTIWIVVASPCIRDALFGIFATEFVGSARGGRGVRMAAILFVGAIVAIIFAIAMPYMIDAASVAAFEFVIVALGERASELVAAIRAILVVIAGKVLGNAFAVRFACEHMWLAWILRRCTIVFVRMVAAIVFKIASIQVRDAKLIGAREEPWCAGVRLLRTRLIYLRCRRAGAQAFTVLRHRHSIGTQASVILDRHAHANVRAFIWFRACILAALHRMRVNFQIH